MEAYHGQDRAKYILDHCHGRGALNVVANFESRIIMVERKSTGSLILWTFKQIYRVRDRDRTVNTISLTER